MILIVVSFYFVNVLKYVLIIMTMKGGGAAHAAGLLLPSLPPSTVMRHKRHNYVSLCQVALQFQRYRHVKSILSRSRTWVTCRKSWGPTEAIKVTTSFVDFVEDLHGVNINIGNNSIIVKYVCSTLLSDAGSMNINIATGNKVIYIYDHINVVCYNFKYDITCIKFKWIYYY